MKVLLHSILLNDLWLHLSSLLQKERLIGYSSCTGHGWKREKIGEEVNNRLKIDIAKIFNVHPFAREIIEQLENAGFEAVIVGGVVRDSIRELIEDDYQFLPDDIDIATSALPTEVKQVFSHLKIISVGEEFGVLLLVAPDGREYEVATFRVEEGYDGRWPAEVELIRDLKGDILRRDLTVNGLAATGDGWVIDYVGGIADLKKKVIRAIGDPEKRFAEDYLRMMRAIRCACSLKGTIDHDTSAAIRTNAAHILSISWERISDELFRILCTDSSFYGLQLLDDHGLLSYILPEVTATKGVAQPEEYHPEGDVYTHTLRAIDVADGFVKDPVVKLAILLHDIGKEYAYKQSGGANMGGHCAVGARMAKEIGKRLRLSRDDMARIDFLVRHHMRIADFPKMGRGKQIRFISEGAVKNQQRMAQRFPLFFDLLKVLIADCEASAHRSAGWLPIISETLRVIDHIDRVCGLNRAREIINGHDILALGVKPGPQIGQLLESIHDRILAGEITSRPRALSEARRLVHQI
jgi:tRNA nucleotidyltransferase/poly(A) polymerase